MLYRTEREETARAAQDFVRAHWGDGDLDSVDVHTAANAFCDEKWPDPGARPEKYDDPAWMIIIGLVGSIVLYVLFGEEEIFSGLVAGAMWFGFWVWIFSTFGRDATARKNGPYGQWAMRHGKRRESTEYFVQAAESTIAHFAKVARESAAADKEREDAKRRPAPVPNCTPRQAEELAARWMKYMGDVDAEVSPATRDGGADVISSRFVAEVKHHAMPVGPGPVRAIVGVAYSQRKSPVFFSLSGYTKDAESFGRLAGVLLFVYDPEKGTIHGNTSESSAVIRDGLAGGRLSS